MFNLPYKDNIFDVVWSNGVIEHYVFEERVKALAEMRRVCKKGGLIINIVPRLSFPYWIGRKISELRGTWDVGYEETFRTLKKEYTRCGITVLEERTYGGMYQLEFLPEWNRIRPVLKFLIPQKLWYALDQKTPGCELMCVGVKETS